LSLALGIAALAPGAAQAAGVTVADTQVSEHDGVATFVVTRHA
jgi:hypothetical protein